MLSPIVGKPEELRFCDDEIIASAVHFGEGPVHYFSL